MNGKVINLDHLRDRKWRSFYPCGYIALSLQQRHSSHSNHEWVRASFRYCPDPQLTDFDEVLLKPAELGQFIRTLLGLRWKADVKRQNMTGCVTSSRWMGTCIVRIPRSGLKFPVDSSQTQKLLQIYVGVFAWLNKEHSERGREIAPFSKCGQKQMATFLFLDHTAFAWGS